MCVRLSHKRSLEIVGRQSGTVITRDLPSGSAVLSSMLMDPHDSGHIAGAFLTLVSSFLTCKQ